MPRSSPAKPPARDSAEGCLLKGSTGSRDWVPLPRTKRSSNHSESKEMRGSGKEEEGWREQSGRERRGERELTAGGGEGGGSRGGGEGAAEREEKEGKGKE